MFTPKKYSPNNNPKVRAARISIYNRYLKGKIKMGAIKNTDSCKRVM
jgi:hypothetical protein